MRNSTQVENLSGLTHRQLDYLARQPGITTNNNPGSGVPRDWNDTATAQAILYGLLTKGEHAGPPGNRAIFNACRVLRLIDWTHPDQIGDRYLIIGPDEIVALVQHPEDIADIATTTTIIPLTMVTSRLEARDEP